MSTSALYPKVLNKPIDFVADTLKVMILDNTYTFDVAHEFLSDVNSHELSGATGYTAGGEALTVTGTYASSKYTFTAPDLTWTGLTATAMRHAILYKDTGSAATSPIISDTDFGVDLSWGGTDFTLRVDPTGFFVRSPA